MTQYKISELADLLGSNKTHIRRLIIRNGILATNEYTREQENHAKEYDTEAKTLLEAYLVPAKERTEGQNEAIQRNMKRNKALKQLKQTELEHKHHETLHNQGETRQPTEQWLIDDRDETIQNRYRNENEVIQLLEKQIEDKNKEIERLINSYEKQITQANLDKATLSRHLDQQQVISLNSQKQIELLQLEIKDNTKVDETKGSEEDKRNLFSIFKRKK